jgi:hypothetical protein
VRDFLKKLWMDEVPITRRSPPVFHSGLQEAIRIMVRDELLAEEGYSQGLDSRPSVRNEVAVWRDNFLYVSLKNRLIKENISPKEYLASLRGSAAIEIDHGRLRALDLTLIPMIAVRSDFQRRLVVPLWPAFQDFLRKNSQSGR